MKVRERLKKRDVNNVQYSISEQGLHVRLNGFKEFVIPKYQLMIINGKMFENEIRENEDIINSPEQATTEAGEAGL